MVKVIICILYYMTCISLIVGCRGVVTPQATASAIPLPESITLNGDQPIVRVPISPALLNNPPSAFKASITAIDNEARLSYGIAVYLERKFDEELAPERVELGRFAAYGPEDAGGFILPAADVFAELQTTLTADEEPELTLVFELLALRETQSLEELEIQLGQFEWIYE